MGWKVRWLAAIIAIVGEGACAQIAGLPDYSAGQSLPGFDSDAPVIRADASADKTSDEVDNESPREQDAGTTGNSDDAAAGDTGQPIDAGQPSDPSGMPDGYACGPGTCGGCCSTAGDCVGGQSVATCGVSGQKCKDCTSSGACVQGECANPPPEAGPPPMCVVASCSPSHCAGFPIQGPCCKSDQTCGCQWTVFAPCL
jgi:hypothetical protein